MKSTNLRDCFTGSIPVASIQAKRRISAFSASVRHFVCVASCCIFGKNHIENGYFQTLCNTKCNTKYSTKNRQRSQSPAGSFYCFVSVPVHVAPSIFTVISFVSAAGVGCMFVPGLYPSSYVPIAFGMPEMVLMFRCFPF